MLQRSRCNPCSPLCETRSREDHYRAGRRTAAGAGRQSRAGVRGDGAVLATARLRLRAAIDCQPAGRRGNCSGYVCARMACAQSVATRTHPRDAHESVALSNRAQRLSQSCGAPLAERDVNGLASLLALELADEYGQEPGPVTTGSALRFQASLAADFSRPVPTVPRPEAYF